MGLPTFAELSEPLILTNINGWQKERKIILKKILKWILMKYKNEIDRNGRRAYRIKDLGSESVNSPNYGIYAYICVFLIFFFFALKKVHISARSTFRRYTRKTLQKHCKKKRNIDV